MARLNFSSSNEFDSRSYRGPTLDNLLEMLQQAKQAQSLQQQRADYAPRPGASPVDGSSTAPGGLLGRWLALQADQQQPRSFGGDREQMPSAPADPNVRRLVRVSPAAQPLSGFGVSNRPYSAFGDSIPPDLLPTSDQGSGESGADTEKPAPVIAGFPRIGRAIPMPPFGPGTLPPIPMPHIREWWQKVQELLRVYGLIRYGRDIGDQEKSAGIAASPAEATILNQRKGPVRGRKIGDDEDDPDPDVWVEKFRKQMTARARERGKAVSRTTNSSNDPGDYCSDRYLEEEKNCFKRRHEYADPSFLNACRDRASERRGMCVSNGGSAHPKENPEWDLNEEEVFRNFWR